MNPAYPWIYLPPQDFTKFLTKFNEKHKIYNLQCQENYGECRFEQSCDDVKQYKLDLDLKFLLTDEHNGQQRMYEIVLPDDLMYINGTRFSDRRKDRACFLPIFRQQSLGDDTIILGSIMMSQYYVVYDASFKNSQNLLVGIGPSNPADIIGKGVVDQV